MKKVIIILIILAVIVGGIIMLNTNTVNDKIRMYKKWKIKMYKNVHS